MPTNPNPFKDINKITEKDLDDKLQIKIGLIEGMSGDIGNIYPGATKVENLGDGKIKINDVEKVVYKHPPSHPASMITGLHAVATSGSYTDIIGTPKELPASDVYPWAKSPTKPLYSASEIGAMDAKLKGTPNGVADLDINGRVPAKELPTSLENIAINGVIDSSYIPDINLAINVTDDVSKVAVLGGLNSLMMKDLTGGGAPTPPPKPMVETTLVDGRSFANTLFPFSAKGAISSFSRSNTLPDNTITTYDISKDKDRGIVVWGITNQTTHTTNAKWFSLAKSIYLNENCDYMFEKLVGITTLDLSDFLFDKVKSMSSMIIDLLDLTTLTIGTKKALQASKIQIFGEGMDKLTTINGTIDIDIDKLNANTNAETNGAWQIAYHVSIDLIMALFPKLNRDGFYDGNTTWCSNTTLVKGDDFNDLFHALDDKSLPNASPELVKFTKSLTRATALPTDETIPILDMSLARDRSILFWVALTPGQYEKDMYWYSDKHYIYFNPDCDGMFYELLCITLNLDLSAFLFDKVINADHMLPDQNQEFKETSLNITGWKGKSLQQTRRMFRTQYDSIIGSINDIDMNHLYCFDDGYYINSTENTIDTWHIPDYNTVIPLTGGSWSKDGTYELSQAPAQTLKPISSGEYDCGKFFRRSTIAPASDITAVDMSWRQDKSILFWKVTENGVEGTEWYSTYDKVYLNHDCGSLGTYLFANVEHLDLSDFLFDKVVDASNMFDKCQMTSLNITGWHGTMVKYLKEMFANIINPSKLVITGCIDGINNVNIRYDSMHDNYYDGANSTYRALLNIANPDSVIRLTGGSWDYSGTYIVLPTPPIVSNTYTKSTLLSGKDFANKLKTLDDKTISGHAVSATNAKSFVKATALPTDKSLPIVDVSEAKDNSIVVWPTIDLNDTTYRTDLHWYSTSYYQYLNADCRNLFSGILSETKDLDLSSFKFDNVILADDMLGDNKFTTLNTPDCTGSGKSQTVRNIFHNIPDTIIGRIDTSWMMINLSKNDQSNGTYNAFPAVNPSSVPDYNTIMPLENGNWINGTFVQNERNPYMLKTITNGDYNCGKFFIKSATPPASGITAVDMSEGQNRNILFWKVTENGVEGTKWYYINGQYDKVCLNPNSKMLGHYLFPDVEDLDLSSFSFDEVIDASNMFDGCKMKTLNILSWRGDSIRDIREMFANVANPSTLVIRGSIEHTNMCVLDPSKFDTYDTNTTYGALKGITTNPDLIITLSGGSWSKNGTYIVPTSTNTPPAKPVSEATLLRKAHLLPKLQTLDNKVVNNGLAVDIGKSKSFVRSATLPTDTTLPIVDVSEAQDRGILVWPTVDTAPPQRTELHWYSDRDKVYLHPDSKELFFYHWLQEATELDLSGFSFDKVINADSMFGENIKTLNITGWKGKSLQSATKMMPYITNITGSIDEIDMNHLVNTYGTMITGTDGMLPGDPKPATLPDYNTIVPLTGGKWDNGKYILSQAPAQTLTPDLFVWRTCGKFFTRSTTPPPSGALNLEDMSWRQDKSILFWQVTENGVKGTHWYSVYDKIYLNATCNFLIYYSFADVINLDLSDFLFDKVINADHMFDKSNATTLNITGWKGTMIRDISFMLSSFINSTNLTITGSIEGINMVNLDDLKMSENDTTNKTNRALLNIANPDSVIRLTGGSWDKYGTYIIPTTPPQ